jgi:hypothetical protein
MLVLVDFSQIVIANVMANFYKSPELINDEETGLPAVRHSVLNSLRNLRMMFHNEDPRIVICCDGKYSWRHQAFPMYKAVRRNRKDADKFNWSQINKYMATVREEIRNNFPYDVVLVEDAEADDVIATLALMNKSQHVVIISRDGDFKQLQIMSHVRQYNQIDDKWVICDDPKQEIKNKVLRGDSGDGIPNILSDDDTFINETKRQRALGPKKLEAWADLSLPDIISEVEKDPKYKGVDVRANIARNRQLIHFVCIPSDVREKILSQFPDEASQDRSKIYDYMCEHELMQLMSYVQQF